MRNCDPVMRTTTTMGWTMLMTHSRTTLTSHPTLTATVPATMLMPTTMATDTSMVPTPPTDGWEWIDTDGDGIGDNADTDDDGDGVDDDADAFPLMTANRWTPTATDSGTTLTLMTTMTAS